MKPFDKLQPNQEVTIATNIYISMEDAAPYKSTLSKCQWFSPCSLCLSAPISSDEMTHSLKTWIESPINYPT